MKNKRDLGYNRNQPLDTYPKSIWCKECGEKIPNVDKYIWIDHIEKKCKKNFSSLCNLSVHDLHSLYYSIKKPVIVKPKPTKRGKTTSVKITRSTK